MLGPIPESQPPGDTAVQDQAETGKHRVGSGHQQSAHHSPELDDPDIEFMKWGLGIAVVLFGLWARYRLDLSRERSARLRDAVKTLRAMLVQERETVASGPSARAQFDDALKAAGLRTRIRLRTAIHRYDEARACCHQDSAGQTLYDSPEAVRIAIDRILRILD